jgi:hypothetical protein
VLNDIKQMTPAAAPAVAAAEAYLGLAATQHMSAPIATTQGTAVSFTGQIAGRSAVVFTDLPGSHPPREAPV